MKSAFLAIAVPALLAAAAAPALAHDDAYLATQPAPNGGQVRMAGPYHFELVTGAAGGTNGRDFVVHVTDHAGAPVATQGARGVAQVLAGKARSSVPLAPDGANRMKGTAGHAVAPDMKVVVSITLPGQPAAQARFAPGQHAHR